MQTNPTSETFRMETDLPGLLTLLADHLYSAPDVFIRELLQNAHDAIVMRRHNEPSWAGHIDWSCDPENKTVTVRDNGIGMDRDDIRHFLSVIGASGKRPGAVFTAELGKTLIGQFGIGLLSAFVVASAVTVHTRKAGTEGLCWENHGSSDCRLSPSTKTDIGTEIILHIRPDYAFVLDPGYLRNGIIRFGNLLPFPISLDGLGPVNAVTPPWHREDWTKAEAEREAYEELLLASGRGYPLEIIPIRIDGEFRARGVIYISDRRAPDFGPKGVLDVYVKRMFAQTDCPSLLPPWAKFVGGIIDSPDLKTTASRDAIKVDDAATVFLQRQLGALIIERLQQLAATEPERFARISNWHHYHLKGMACYDPEFFDLVADLLIFETNHGPHPLGACFDVRTVDAGSPAILRYFTGTGMFAQYERLAEARGWRVVDASRGFDEQFLQLYGKHRAGQVRLLCLDAGDDPALFVPLATADAGRYRLIENELADLLRQRGLEQVRVRTCSFVPTDIPALAQWDKPSAMAAADNAGDIHPGLMEMARDALAALGEAPRPQRVTLFLNAANPLIQQLGELGHYRDIETACREGESPLLDSMLSALFGSALLCSGRAIRGFDAELLRGQLGQLFSETLGLLDRYAWLTAKAEKLRQAAGAAPAPTASRGNTPHGWLS